MTVKISNSGSDEHGRYRNGKAGDQTGREWRIISNYNRPWSCVLRLKDKAARELLGDLAIEAAENDHIGYDQNQRTTYWEQLKKNSYRPKNIKIDCESDCSAGVMTNLKAVGYILSIDKLKALPITSTHYMRKVLMDTGLFDIFTTTKYTSASSEYLAQGDILLNDQHHTATVVENGKLYGVIEPKPVKKQTYIKYEVTASELNFREGPGTKYRINRIKKKGAKMNIGQIKNGWGQTKTGDWGSMKYMRKM